jgi:hypothetical protein
MTDYQRALDIALDLMAIGLEPTSALKQAAELHGIPYGEAMGQFVNWSLNNLSKEITA